MPPEGNEANGTVDLAGYSSVDELVKAYRASGDEAKRQKQRGDQLEQQARTLEQQYARPTIPNRTDPASRLAEYGVPVDALDDYVGGRIRAGIVEAFEPLNNLGRARNHMLSSYPDYNKFEADVAKFVESDSQLSQSYPKMFAADPVGAMEFAYLKFGAQARNGQPVTPAPQAQARAEAQIPSSRSGDARTQPSAGDENITRAWEHYQKTNDPRAYAKARLRQVIPDEFLTR